MSISAIFTPAAPGASAAKDAARIRRQYQVIFIALAIVLALAPFLA